MPRSEPGAEVTFSLHVRNIPYDISQDRLFDLFGEHGKVTDVYIPKDYHTGRIRGFAYVQFESKEGAELARSKCDGMSVDGRALGVEWALGTRKASSEMAARDGDTGRGGGYRPSGDRRGYDRGNHESSSYDRRYDRRERGGERDYCDRRDRDYDDRRDYSRRREYDRRGDDRRDYDEDRPRRDYDRRDYDRYSDDRRDYDRRDYDRRDYDRRDSREDSRPRERAPSDDEDGTRDRRRQHD